MNGCGIVYKDSIHKIMHITLEESIIFATIVDVSARVSVTQVYKNQSNSPTSRTKYVFPVPPRAAVCAFSLMRQDQHIIYGVVKENSKAVEDHEGEIRGDSFSTAVEWASDDVFTISLGSIPANETVTTRVTFVMDLMDEEADKIRLQLPSFLGDRFGYSPLGLNDITSTAQNVKVQITVEIQTSGEILSIMSPTHENEIRLEHYKTHYGRPSRRRMIAKFHSKSFLDRDFALVIQADAMDAARCFMEEDRRNATVALQLTLIPKFHLPPIARQEYIFLVDHSESMLVDRRMDITKESIEMLIRCLPRKNTLFNIFTFGTNYDRLWEQSVVYNEQNLEQAVQYIREIDTELGGTEIRRALDAVFSSRHRMVPTVFFVLTGGELTEEKPVHPVVRSAVDVSLSDAPIRLFVLGIGIRTSVVTYESLARTGNGGCLVVSTLENIPDKLSALLRAGRTSTIKDISIDWGAATPNRTSLLQPDGLQQSPPAIKCLYPHNRYLVFAILNARKAPRNLNVVIRGKTDAGEVVELDVEVESVKFGKDSSSPPFVHTLAARQLIRDLEKEKTTSKLPEVAWKKAIIHLGERYRLTTSHTSFVPVDYSNVVVPVASKKRDTKLRSKRDNPDVSPVGVMQTVWTYISNPVRGSWMSGSERSHRADESDDSRGSFDSITTFSTMSSFRSHSSFESGHERRGRRSRSRSRPRREWTHSERSRSPQIHPTGEAVYRRNLQQIIESEPPRRVSSDVYRLVGLMSFEGSFALTALLKEIALLDLFERVRALHVDESLCAAAVAIVYLKKKLKDQRELLTVLVDKVMEFVNRCSDDNEFRPILTRARELIS